MGQAADEAPLPFVLGVDDADDLHLIVGIQAAQLDDQSPHDRPEKGLRANQARDPVLFQVDGQGDQGDHRLVLAHAGHPVGQDVAVQGEPFFGVAQVRLQLLLANPQTQFHEVGMGRPPVHQLGGPVQGPLHDGDGRDPILPQDVRLDPAFLAHLHLHPVQVIGIAVDALLFVAFATVFVIEIADDRPDDHAGHHGHGHGDGGHDGHDAVSGLKPGDAGEDHEDRGDSHEEGGSQLHDGRGGLLPLFGGGRVQSEIPAMDGPHQPGGGEEIALVACGLLPLGVGLPMPPSRGRPILRGDDGAGGEDAFMGQGPQIGVLVRNGQLGGMIDADETAADADPHIQKGDHVPHG